MAERSGKIAAGQAYIEVEYDYEYEVKDRKTVIRQGECYLLVKKTNDDWWQVRPDENSKAFYVPAQYVKVVTRKVLMPPVKQATGLPNNSMKTIHSMHLQRLTENVNKIPKLSSLESHYHLFKEQVLLMIPIRISDPIIIQARFST